MGKHSMKLKKATGYWKAIIAVVGAAATAVTAVSVDADVITALPPQWTGAVVAGGAALTGLVAALKRNTTTFEQVDESLAALPLDELRALLAKYTPKV